MSYRTFFERIPGLTPILDRLIRDSKALIATHREKLPYVAAALLCLIIYAFGRNKDESVSIFKSTGAPDFKDGKILGGNGESLYEGKERLMSKSMREILAAQANLRESNERLLAKVTELEKVGTAAPAPIPSTALSTSLENSNSKLDDRSSLLAKDPVRLGSDTMTTSSSSGSTSSMFPYRERTRSVHGSRELGGNSIISFPVKDIPQDKVEGVVLPSGSYVKAKLMTGVEAPESKTFPVLLQLDYAYIIPNKKRLDLSGCFMIAKSQGDLSTERVQMQATKLSCVSKKGKMFEREVNGFVADDKDNSFAVMGKVNSKQDRVAAMAFLSSIVEGVGKAVQQAQMTQTTNALGGSQSVLTGDQGAYLAAGGASNAASMVTQWYLKQAQNLLPTINIGSGQDVWIVIQDKVALPNDYFRKNVKGESREGFYSYFSRIAD